MVGALGLALVHSLWQVTLVAALTATALAALGRRSSNARYVAACVGLGAMFVLPLVTFVRALQTAAVTTARLAAAAPLVGPVSLADNAYPWLPVRAGAVLPWIVWAWALGVLLLSLRLLSCWVSVMRLARRRSAAPRSQWQAIFDRLRDRMNLGRMVTLVESAAVSVPTAIGWVRPVVLLPLAALSGLTPRQVEAILAHELAHVRRYDYLVNLFQSAVETLLFFHPGVWWLSSRIRLEREHCCDDAAVAALGDALGYARALTLLEQRRFRGARLAAAATGGPLMKRIERLKKLFGPAAPGGRPNDGWRVAPALFLVFALVVILSAAAVPAAYAPSDASMAAAAADQPRPGRNDSDAAFVAYYGNRVREIWCGVRRRLTTMFGLSSGSSSARQGSATAKPGTEAERVRGGVEGQLTPDLAQAVREATREAEVHAREMAEQSIAMEAQAREFARQAEEAARQAIQAQREDPARSRDAEQRARDMERRSRELQRRTEEIQQRAQERIDEMHRRIEQRLRERAGQSQELQQRQREMQAEMRQRSEQLRRNLEQHARDLQQHARELQRGLQRDPELQKRMLELRGELERNPELQRHMQELRRNLAERALEMRQHSQQLRREMDRQMRDLQRRLREQRRRDDLMPPAPPTPPAAVPQPPGPPPAPPAAVPQPPGPPPAPSAAVPEPPVPAAAPLAPPAPPRPRKLQPGAPVPAIAPPALPGPLPVPPSVDIPVPPPPAPASLQAPPVPPVKLPPPAPLVPPAPPGPPKH